MNSNNICRNDTFIQNVCNTPGITCKFIPNRVQADNCGNTIQYTETVNISSQAGTNTNTSNLINAGFSPYCIRR